MFCFVFKLNTQWALCSQRSHGTKSTMLESKLRTGTSTTKKMQICLDEVALFWMSQWTALQSSNVIEIKLKQVTTVMTV